VPEPAEGDLIRCIHQLWGNLLSISGFLPPHALALGGGSHLCRHHQSGPRPSPPVLLKGQSGQPAVTLSIILLP
jgi:hypothetical protein